MPQFHRSSERKLPLFTWRFAAVIDSHILHVDSLAFIIRYPWTGFFPGSNPTCNSIHFHAWKHMFPGMETHETYESNGSMKGNTWKGVCHKVPCMEFYGSLINLQPGVVFAETLRTQGWLVSRVSRQGRSQSDHIMAPYKSYKFPYYDCHDRPGIIYGPEYGQPGIINFCSKRVLTWYATQTKIFKYWEQPAL